MIPNGREGPPAPASPRATERQRWMEGAAGDIRANENFAEEEDENDECFAFDDVAVDEI